MGWRRATFHLSSNRPCLSWSGSQRRRVLNVGLSLSLWLGRYLVNLGCIKPLCDLLTVMDSKIVQVALNGLENILRLGEQEAKQSGSGINPYCGLIEEAYGESPPPRNPFLEAAEEGRGAGPGFQGEDFYNTSYSPPPAPCTQMHKWV